jgi:UDP-GlcNAc:undecaprenyl-phosphate/decaprenyl-phosphate GlcNAc-1-phosphate transferase
MPSWHWLILGSAILTSALLTLEMRRFVLRSEIGLSQPRERDIHTKAIPRLGGVAISLSFLFTCIGVLVAFPDALWFVPNTFLGIDKNLFGILAGVLLLLIVGIIDDIGGLHPFVKLAFHFIAGAILAYSSVLITHVTNPFGGQIDLGIWSFLFVVIWVVGMINVINFLDGLDGLASGVSLIATIILYLLALKPDVYQPSMAVLAIILAGSLIGFLPFNFYPAKIFMGDSGSQVLGFMLAAFAIISGGKLATAFLVLGVPILDVLWVIFRRLMNKQSIYKADRYHLHHRLLKAGLGQREAVILLYAISAGFGIIALQTQSMGKLIAALLLIGIMIIGGATLVVITAWKQSKIAQNEVN